MPATPWLAIGLVVVVLVVVAFTHWLAFRVGVRRTQERDARADADRAARVASAAIRRPRSKSELVERLRSKGGI